MATLLLDDMMEVRSTVLLVVFLLGKGFSQDCSIIFNGTDMSRVIVDVSQPRACFQCVLADGTPYLATVIRFIPDGFTRRITLFNNGATDNGFSYVNHVLVIEDPSSHINPGTRLDDGVDIECFNGVGGVTLIVSILLSNVVFPLFTGDPPTNTVHETTLVVVSCRDPNGPELIQVPTIWYFPNGSIIGDGSNVLNFRISRYDAGVYVCRSILIGGGSINITQEYIVEYPPEVTTIKPDGIIAFDLLGTFSVSCDYVGLPVPTVQWFHNNTLLDVTDPNIIIFNSSDTTSVVTQITTELTRINSSYEVGGDYICQLSNELGSVAASVIIARILINCGPPSLPIDGHLIDFDYSDSNTREGATVIYQCDAGFQPISEMVTFCTNEGVWIPDPEELNCTFIPVSENVNSLPALLFDRGSSVVAEGSVIWLYCEMNSISSSLTFLWSKDQFYLVQDVPHIRIRTTTFATRTTSILIVDNFQDSFTDGGIYRCITENNGSVEGGRFLNLTASTSSPGSLRILNNDGIITAPFSTNSSAAIDGNAVSLDFQFGHVGDESRVFSIPSVIWLKDGLPFRATPTNTPIIESGRLVSSLQFDFEESGDAGVYQCVVTDTDTSEIYVTIPIRLDTGNTLSSERLSPFITIVRINDKLVLETRTSGRFDLIAWIRNGVLQGTDNFFPSSLQLPHFNEIYVLPSVSAIDLGIYEVHLFSDSGLQPPPPILFVVVEEVNVSVAIGDGFINEVTVFEGRHVDISCIFTGIPVPTSVTWTFDSQTTNFSQFDRPRGFTIELRSGSTVPVVTNGELTSTLRIVNAQYPSNDGVFECIGEVATERTNVTVRVLVDCGEPRPPINGFVVNFDNTRSGYTATYRCYNGYIPRDLQTTTCTDARVWIPEPEEYNCTSTVSESVRSLPASLFNVGSHSVVEGSVIWLYCVVTFTSSVIVTWTKDNIPLVQDVPHVRIITTISTTTISKLLIVDNFQNSLSDSGVYRCNTEDSGTVEAGRLLLLTASVLRPGSLQIFASDRIIAGNNANNRTSFSDGDAVSLDFEIGHIGDDKTDFSTPQVMWFKDGLLFRENARNIPVNNRGRLVTRLQFDFQEPGDAGVYQCVITDTTTSEIYITIPIRLDTGDTLISESESPFLTFLRIPDKLVLELRTSGRYDAIIWARNGVIQGTGNFLPSSQQLPHFGEIYVLPTTTTTDLGLYEMELLVPSGLTRPPRLRFAVIEEVNFNLAISDGFNNEIIINEGEDADISCSSTAIPVPTSITWTFNNQATPFIQTDISTDFDIQLELDDFSNVVPVVTRGELMSTLHIVNAQYPSHDGVYECIGDIVTERVNITVQILVDCGVPIPPINGFLVNYDTTKVGGTVIYRCDNGFTPTSLQSSACTYDRLWIPALEDLNCTSTVSQRVRTLPDILFNQGNYAVLEGSVVWLYCEIDLSSPSLTLSWNKDRILLVQDVPHIRIRTTTSANVISVFLIVDSFQASFSDGGIYQCVAEDDGTAEVGRSLNLTVSVVSPGSLQIITNDQIITQTSFRNRTRYVDGNNVSLDLQIGHVGDVSNSFSFPSVMWLKDGLPFRVAPMNLQGSNGRLITSLHFTFQEPGDAGVYQCIITDTTTSEIYITIPIRLDTGDTIISERVSPFVTVLQIPDKLVLELRTSGRFNFIVWARNGVLIPTSQQFTHFTEIYAQSNTNNTDLGLYDVELLVPEGLTRPTRVQFAVVERVNFSIVISDGFSNEVRVNEGEDVNISCTALGIPVPTSVTWTLNDQNTRFNQTDIHVDLAIRLVMDTSRNIMPRVTSGEIVSTLHIMNAQYPSHEGTYQCIGDTVTERITVRVLGDCGVPVPPIDGFLVNYNSTRVESTVIYKCNDLFRPSALQISTCTNARLWIPALEEHICTYTGIKLLPPLLFDQESRIIVEGSVVWLYCEVNSTSPSLTVTWNKDNVPLVQNVPHIRIRTTTSASIITSILIVDNFQVSNSDAGIYWCSTEDEGTIATGSSVNLTVLALSPGSLQIFTNDEIVSVGNRTSYTTGDSISLDFEIGHVGDDSSVFTVPSIMWLKDGLPFRVTSSNIPIIGNGRLVTRLQFDFQEPGDAGVYQCVITDTTTSEIYIAIPIRLDTGNILTAELVSPSAIIHRIPDKLVLEVRTSGGYGVIGWFRNGAAQASDSFFQQLSHFNEIYSLPTTTVADLGLYQVLLVSPLGLQSPPILQFSVAERVNITVVSSNNEVMVFEGEDVDISCNFTGIPVPTSITWTLNNQITPFKQTDISVVDFSIRLVRSVPLFITGELMSTLHIMNARYPFDVGVYECIGDMVTESIIVQVIVDCGVPIPPIGGSLVNYDSTKVDSTVTYKCDDFYQPTTLQISTCTNTRLWIPLLEEHNCTYTGISSYPIFLFEQGSSAIIEGSVIWLYCRVELTSPSLTVRWNKDGIPLVQDVPHIRIRTITSANITTSILIVDNVQKFFDSGIYLCITEDEGFIGAGRSVNLTVSASKRGSIQIVTSDELISGQSATNRTGYVDRFFASLDFQVGHVGDAIGVFSIPSVLWLKDGVPFRIPPAIIPIIGNGRLITRLAFFFREPDDAGVYQCVLTDTSTSEIYITVPIRLDTGNILTAEIVSPPLTVLRIPDKLVLELRTSGRFDDIHWIRNGVLQGSGSFLPTSQQLPHFNEIFVLPTTTNTDLGLYEVELSPVAASPPRLQFAVVEQVNVSIALSDGFNNEVTVFEGDDVDISCTSTGIPVPTAITWILNNYTTPFNQTDTLVDFTIELPIGSMVPVVTNGELMSTLHIVNAQYPSHDGVYECIGDVVTEKMNVIVQVIVDCGVPIPPIDGLLVNYDSTKAGSTVIYRCNDGFRPSTLQRSTCTNERLWIPAPEEHNCTFIIAFVDLILNSDVDIDCPGDIISYNCSVISDSDMVNLIWHITFPDFVPINVTYNNNSILNSKFNFALNASTILTEYMNEEYIESVITFVVVENITLNGTIVECETGGIENATEVVLVNSSVPLIPTGFNITGEYYTMMDTTVTFEWDLPSGSGPEAIVDNYTILINPRTISHPVSITGLLSSPLNVTLDYNVVYTASIIALNCVGESDSLLFTNIKYVNCGVPVITNGILGNYSNTREGATVPYQCLDGYRPSSPGVSTCTNTALWIPILEEINCTFVTASVILDEFSRSADIECPGDTISYNCSILSNSEAVHLVWRITFPDTMPISITYDNESILDDIDYLRQDTSSILTTYRSDEYIESILIFTLITIDILNGTEVECKIGDLDEMTVTLFINSSVPLSPTGLDITMEYYTLLDTTVTFEWDPPRGSGPEAIVDNYTLSITPVPLSHPQINAGLFMPWNVTLSYNVLYTAALIAVNCFGESIPLFLTDIEYVNCDAPGSPINGFLGNYSHTREGSIVTYQCNDGFRPSAVMTSTCTSNALWIPAPEQHNCTLVIASVSLQLIERSTARADIDCPGDVISYNCSILSNIETLYLIWIITFPGLMPISIVYDNTSLLNTMNELGMNVSSRITAFESDEYIESELEFTVLRDVLQNGAILECILADLDNKTVSISVNISEPLVPTGFNITKVYYTEMDTTVLFEREQLTGIGPEAIVDSYIIEIMPLSISHPISNIINSTAFNVTLNYNVVYTATIIAVNCAGESNSFELTDIEYVNCGVPIPPLNGYLGNYTHTREGANVIYQCNIGFRPSSMMLSTCTNSAMWIPAPDTHNCTLIIASVTLNRITEQLDIDCPGDTIIYNCSILSNSETVHLTWHITVPNKMPISITYDNTSVLEQIDLLTMTFSTVLTNYTDDVYVESIVVLNVLKNTPVNGTGLECSIGDLDVKTAYVFSSTSIPLTPTGLNITVEYYTVDDNTVTFEWDPPPGSGPEAIVDNYTILIIPTPVSHPMMSVVLSSPWNVTLDYNVNYTATIIAANCAGESDGLELINIKYVNCGVPMPPVDGYLGNYSHSREGGTVTFQCNGGFLPSDVMISTCTASASWNPAPENHSCILITASISLNSSEIITLRSDIDCPGDTLSYNCTILSNSETLNLIWSVVFPGLIPISITYNNTSALNSMDILTTGVSSVLTRFITGVYIESIMVLSVRRNVQMNGTKLKCSIDDMDSKTTTVFVNTSVPLIPTGLQVVMEYYTVENSTITFTWNPPPGSGPEAIVDNYTISIEPAPISHSMTSVGLSSPWNVTLNYNVEYSATIIAINCAGESDSSTLNDIEHVNCGSPMPPADGYLGNYSHTREGATVTYRCNDGFRPSAIKTSTCINSALWNPAPEDHSCISITASVSIIPYERNTLRSDIDCPGDTISYNCSILSNSEAIHLTWSVHFPGLMPVTITYDNTSALNSMDNLAMGVSSVLTSYTSGVYVNSIIVLTVLNNLILNGTKLECAIGDLENTIIDLFVNISVPLTPTGLNITTEYYMVIDNTVTFEWDPPPGIGPEAIVDNYTISIIPKPLSHPILSVGLSFPWNVTLDYNVNYRATIVAVNCAGESDSLGLNIIEYVNCDDPITPLNGYLGNYPHTREGATVAYQCNDGFRPSVMRISTCTSSSLWIPAPQDHSCVLVTASVALNLYQRNKLRSDIDCPGDTLSYNCSILSNSETVHLVWSVKFPEFMPFGIKYDNTSVLNGMDNPFMGVSTILTSYISDEYIESIIVLTLLSNVMMDGIRIECGIGNLNNMTTNVSVNLSVPLTPTGLQVVMEYYTVEDNTVTFAWDPPPGSGPEAIVDNYTISIMPIPVSHSITSVGLSSPWNVTLNYNVNYTATIIALNCAGMSDSLELISIEYVNCGAPIPPVNGYLNYSSHTREGATVTYQCNDGFRPSDVMISTCTASASWNPAPENHNCIFITASLSLNSHERNVLRSDIDCPGDTIAYNCSILSNSETIRLIWSVQFPGLMPITITYDDSSVLNNMNYLAMNISTVLTSYVDSAYVDSIIVLTVLRNVIMNGTKLECGVSALENIKTTILVNTSVPLTPTGLNITMEYYAEDNSTVTFTWNPPPGSGPEAIVDNYTISIEPAPISHSMTSVGLSSPWNVTLNYNVEYSVTIIAINCAGESDSFTLNDIEYVNCGTPMPPADGYLGNYSHTREGATVTYRCNDGFRPSIVRISTCINSVWNPAPEDHNCIFITASVSLIPSERNISRSDIDCPGDTISYNCSILSNSETIHLIWSVDFPGFMPVTITYDNTSALNSMDNLAMGVSSVLTSYINGIYIDSIIVLTILKNVMMNGTKLECAIIGELGNTITTLLTNISVPLTPTGLNILMEYYTVEDNTVTFEWDPPPGNGPETIVDNYTITITPVSVSHPMTNVGLSSPWNVTLNYNVEYTATIVAVNCAGESESLELNNIEYVNCGDPIPPPDGSLGTYSHTRAGATVNYQCNVGFVPSAVRISTCTNSASWNPPPENHNCISVTATISLIPYERNTLRSDIDCPGDTISYNCSILSNSETVQLIWSVEIPGLVPITITYDNSSVLNSSDNLAMNISSILLSYINDTYIHSMIILTVLRDVKINGTKLKCAIDNLENIATTLYVNTSVPLTPAGFNIIMEYYTVADIKITFEWDPPLGSGPEVIVDNYTISITSIPVSQPIKSVGLSSPWNVTLNYNINYTATIIAVNCAGESNRLQLNNIEYVNCGVPIPPIDGHLGNYSHSREETTVIYQCNDGFRPSDKKISTCTSSSLWIPAPQDHSCILVTASVSIIPYERNTLRSDIDCPGDTVSYNCSILSNSETLHLTWSVHFPGLMPVTITYDNTSILNNMDNFGLSVNSVLIRYINDVYIESIVVLTLLRNMTINEAGLDCAIGDLDNNLINIFVNTSVPLIPTGFDIILEYYTDTDITVTFEWDPPPGSGSEAIVDNYTISITPIPVSHPITSVGLSSPWNVTLKYNVEYRATISAVNCAGNSDPLASDSMEYVNCGVPLPPNNGFLGNFNHTREGAIVTYQCNDRFRPTAVKISLCSSNSSWIPAPEEHSCTSLTESVSLTPYERIPDIDCPGDTISYNCSILSNDEMVHLIWLFILPGHMPVTIKYDNISTLNNTDSLPFGVSTLLTEYRTDEYIESIIVLTVLRNVTVNGTILNCISNLENETVTISVNSSEPLPPINFNLTDEREEELFINVNFKWNPPTGNGPEFVIDHYLIIITPEPITNTSTNKTSFPFWNVSLDYNVIYTASITSVNCAGESNPVTFNNIIFGKSSTSAGQSAVTYLSTIVSFLGIVYIVIMMTLLCYFLLKRNKSQQQNIIIPSKTGENEEEKNKPKELATSISKSPVTVLKSVEQGLLHTNRNVVSGTDQESVISGLKAPPSEKLPHSGNMVYSGKMLSPSNSLRQDSSVFGDPSSFRSNPSSFRSDQSSTYEYSHSYSKSHADSFTTLETPYYSSNNVSSIGGKDTYFDDDDVTDFGAPSSSLSSYENRDSYQSGFEDSDERTDSGKDD